MPTHDHLPQGSGGLRTWAPSSSSPHLPPKAWLPLSILGSEGFPTDAGAAAARLPSRAHLALSEGKF